MSPERSQIVTGPKAALDGAGAARLVRRARSGSSVAVASKIETERALLGKLAGLTPRRGGRTVKSRLQPGSARILRRALRLVRGLDRAQNGLGWRWSARRWQQRMRAEIV